MDTVIAPSDDLVAALKQARAGDTITLLPGTYQGGISLSSIAGTPVAPITVTAETPGTAIFEGSSDLQHDGLNLYKCPFWIFKGIVFQHAARAGMFWGASPGCQAIGCVFRANTTWGVLTGSSSNILFDGCEFSSTVVQHGLYISSALADGSPATVRNCKMIRNGMSGLQFNSPGVHFKGCLVENCQFFSNGVATPASSINCLGMENSVFRGNDIINGKQNGIIFGAGSTGNVVSGNLITFRSGEGQQCIVQGGALTPTTLSADHNTCRQGNTKAAIQLLGNATIVQDANTILPVAGTETTIPTGTSQ